jgi:asparagine synthase (glutamine-hydrolysing)
MCGIAGIFNFDPERRADRALLERMTSLVAHRGPDDAGHEIFGNVGLGHRRLSIIDVSTAGHQPMANDDGSVWIAYNGECYNYRELASGMRARGHRFKSDSDTEVILRLYEERGEACFRELDGMFALAIYDGRRQRLILARDRIGIKPLSYHYDSNRLIFASESKALLADPATPAKLDITALSDYLHLLSIPDPRSIFGDVRKLQPGHYLVITTRGVKEEPYWSLPVSIDESMSYEAAAEEFERRFDRAVQSHMVADVPVGAFLSGGVDSSAIVSAAGRVSNTPIETFSITFPGLDEFDESPFAEAVAARCGAKHHAFNLAPHLVEALPRIAWHADEPFAISSAFALYFIAKVARERVKVVLTGDGGDEVFGGYVWRHSDFGEPHPAAAAWVERATVLLRRHPKFRGLMPKRMEGMLRRLQGRDERYLQSFTCFLDNELLDLLEPSLAGQVVDAWENNIVQHVLETAPSKEQLARKLYTDIKTTLVSEMLTKADRMTMAHGLEARVPFLDHHLVEWAFTIPGRHKIRTGSGKALVKTAMERHLPHHVLYRQKQGFNVPMKVWMRGELREFVRDTLTTARLSQRGFFRPEAVESMLADHFSGRRDSSNKIFALLMLELWHQLFVDGRTELGSLRVAA